MILLHPFPPPPPPPPLSLSPLQQSQLGDVVFVEVDEDKGIQMAGGNISHTLNSIRHVDAKYLRT